MRTSFVHIIIAILLTIAHMGGEILSRTDVACGKCADEQICCIVYFDTENQQDPCSQKEQKKEDRHSEQHSANVCSCPCHIIGIEVATYIPVIVESALVSYHSPEYSLPSYIPSSPDHVPLV